VDPGRYDAAGLKAFRSLYPSGRDFVVCPYVMKPYALRRGGRVITVCGSSDLPA
jgi:hypothetical protein